MRPSLALLLIVAVIDSAATGDSKPGDSTARPVGPWRHDADAPAFARPWLERCRRELNLPEDDEGPGPHLSARPTPGGIDLSIYEAGSGRWAYASETNYRLEHGSCAGTGFSIEGGKESLLGGVRRLALGGRPLASLEELAARREAVVARAPEESLAAARLLVQLVGRSDSGEPGAPSKAEADVLGPALPLQPDHPGRPRGSPTAWWMPAELAAAGVAEPWLANESKERFDAIETFRVRPPSLLVRKAAMSCGRCASAPASVAGSSRSMIARPSDTAGSSPPSMTMAGTIRRRFAARVATTSSRATTSSPWRSRRRSCSYASTSMDAGTSGRLNLATGTTRRVTLGGRVMFRCVPDGVEVSSEEGEPGERRIIPLAQLRP